MKTLRWLAGSIALPSALALAEQSAIPQPLPADLYEKLLTDSPFAVATAPVAVEKPEEPWAANLFLGGASQETNENGQKEDWAFIKQRGDAPGVGFSLTPSETGPDGIKLVRIEWAEESINVKAVLTKGDKEAKVGRNENDFNQVAAPTAPVRPGGQPGAVANPGANLLNAAAGVRKLPAPAGAQAIPRPTVVPPAAANPAAPAQPGNNRQRIRVIEPGPRAR